MKLTELTKDLTEAMKICKENKVNPNIWVEIEDEIMEIDKIKLEIGLNINDEKVSNLTFIIHEEEKN